MKRARLAMLVLWVLVDLNTASIEELVALPGIGPVIAGRIVEFREKRGGFRRVEELLAIRGVSERMWQELRRRVEVPSAEDGPVAREEDDEAVEAGQGEGTSGSGDAPAGQNQLEIVRPRL